MISYSCPYGIEFRNVAVIMELGLKVKQIVKQNGRAKGGTTKNGSK